MREDGSRRQVVRRLLALAALLGALGAWSVVRTDRFLEAPLRHRLDRLGERLGGHFDFEAIGPDGLTGIEIRGLTFEVDGADGEAGRLYLSASHLRLQPDLSRLLAGEIGISEARLSGVVLEAEGRLGRLARPLLSPAVSRRGEPGRRGGPTALHRLPEVLVVDELALTLSHHVDQPGQPPLELRGRLRDVAIRREAGTSRVTATGHADLEGLAGGRFRLVRSPSQPLLAEFHPEPGVNWFDQRETLERWVAALGDPGRVPFVGRRGTNRPPIGGVLGAGRPTGARCEIGVIRLSWPLALELHELRVSRLNLALPLTDRWRLDGLEVERVHLGWGAPEASIGLEGVTLAMAGIPDDADIHLDGLELRADRAGDGPVEVVLRDRRGGRLGLRGRPGGGVAGEGEAVVEVEAEGYPLDSWAPILTAGDSLQLHSGRITGRLRATRAAGGALQMTLDGALEETALTVPVLASRPLEALNLGLRAEVTAYPAEARLELADGRLSLGGIPLTFEGALWWSEEAPRLRLRARGEAVSAEGLRRALPRGLAPSLEDARLAGTLSGQLELDLDASRPDDARVALDLDVSEMTVVQDSPQAPVAALTGDFVLDLPLGDGTGRRVGPDRSGWVAYEAVPAHLRQAIVSAEDGRFWEHSGFDWGGILRSVEVNLRERRFARGGSTLSQQLARTLFLGQERTLGRKFEEAFLTWRLERVLSKRRILELYLNTVHWGPGIHGIAEAAAAYFRRRPEDLSLREAAFLAAILPNPDLFGVQYARGIVTPSRREKMCSVLRNMRHLGQLGLRDYYDHCRAIQEGEISVVPPPEHLLPGADPPTAPPPLLSRVE